MFLFFGITPKTKRYGFVSSFCDAHGGHAEHELASYRSWFKLFFFLPLFPVGRERHLLTCSECGAAYELSSEEAQQLAAQARDINVPMAGGFGGGRLGQLFGGAPAAAPQRNPKAEPYPKGDAHVSDEDDVYRTTPRPAPDQPMRVRSRRLDRGA